MGANSSGSINITSLPPKYQIGEEYQISVSISHNGQKRWGFLLQARDSSGNPAGDFSSIDNNTQTFSGYISHTLSGTFRGQSNSANWDLKWTAPADDVGSITFMAHGNAANNNDANSGDKGHITTVSITADDANTGPVANDQSVSTNEDTAKSITLSATDADSDALTYTVVSQPSDGTLYIERIRPGTAFNVIYRPNAGFSGNDSFTFKANDGKINSAVATVSIVVINIPDPNLRKALEVALQINIGEEITKEDLAGLTTLIDEHNSPSLNIVELTGLDPCLNLTTVHLADNKISDLSSLSKLAKLESLVLKNNQIIDINPISELSNLTDLFLETNQVTDISPLSNLTNLVRLYLGVNQIKNIAPLANLVYLIKLRLDANQISDISTLINLTNLTVLYLNNNQINDISSLSNLSQLIELRLDDNKVTDITALVENTGISGKINLKDNPLSNTTLSTHIPALEARGIKVEYDMPGDVVLFRDANLEQAIRDALGIPTKLLKKEDLVKLAELKVNNENESESVKIADLTGLEHCTNLQRLELRHNKITNLNPISNLTELTSLHLQDNQVSDVSMLSNLVKLTVLILLDNQVININSLAGLVKLEMLDLAHNKIVDISSLTNLTQLWWVALNGNQIPIIPNFSKLDKLEELNLGGNLINDISPLDNLLEIVKLVLDQNSINDISSLSEIKISYLSLPENQIADISPLTQNTRISGKIHLKNNPLSNTALSTYIPALEARGIKVEYDLPEGVILFKDANLEKAIRDALGIPTELLKKEDLTGLKMLAYEGKGGAKISDLTGLEHCTSLTNLELKSNQLSDLSPLVNLVTGYLDLRSNQISDISALVENTGISGKINLKDNPLNNAALSTYIPALEAKGIKVEYDIPGGVVLFKDINLDKAIRDALGIPIELLKKEDLAKLTELEYTGFKLAENERIADLTGLEFCSQLIRLNLEGNQIDDIGALADLTNLVHLSVIYNQISDLSPLSNLSQLTRLELDANEIFDISPLWSLDNLDWLSLSKNKKIYDLSHLESLSKLTKLELGNNQISQIRPLVRNTGISGEIKLTSNQLSNTALTADIPALMERGIIVEYDQAPADIVKMSNSNFEASLRKGLNIPTETITASNTSAVTDLNLSNTGVVDLDVKVLKALTKLKSINLTNNPLSANAILVQIPELESAGITVNLGTSVPAKVELVAEKPAIPASLASTTDIVVTVTDASGKLVKRETVGLTVDKGTIQSPAANNGDGTYTASYAAVDTVGEVQISAITSNGKFGSVSVQLVEPVVSSAKSTLEISIGSNTETGGQISIVVMLLNDDGLPLSGQKVELKVNPEEKVVINPSAKTDKEGKTTITFTAGKSGMKIIRANINDVELASSAAAIFTGDEIDLESVVGDADGNSSVNIFDLVIVAGQFGENGTGLSGDVNGDSNVNIFDLVMVAGNFGKSAVAAAPTLLTRELTFNFQQKRSIQLAVVELEDMPVRSEAEELVFSLLIAMLPERLPEQTQLLSNYPNPFNPETWIPFELSQDSKVSVTIYNIAGTPVRNISVGYLQAGSYVSQLKSVYWDGKSDTGERVSSGTYFYQIRAGDYTETRKMVILK